MKNLLDCIVGFMCIIAFMILYVFMAITEVVSSKTKFYIA